MKDLFRLDGKVAVVIGGAGGIGQGIAEAMAFYGAEVVIASRKMESLVRAKSEIKEKVGKDVAIYTVDATNEDSIIALVNTVVSNHKKADILVNAQGYNKKFSLFDFPMDVMADMMNPMMVASTQWFERTLDDSANKRLSIPEGFLAIDGILDLYLNVVDGLVVYPKVIEKRLMSELPFMATENIMMDAVKAGGDRQELHEKIRTLSMEAGKNVKEKGLDNNLLELIAADPAFNLTLEELNRAMEPSRYTGRAKEQVEEFLDEVIRPLLDANQAELGVKAEINV